MLETPEYPTATQGGDNAAVGSISRKDVLLAWLAGAWDGEGCIFAYFRTQTNPKCKGTRTLSVGASIHNNHPLFLRKVGEALSMIGVPFTYTVANRDMQRKSVNVAIKIAGKSRLEKLLNAIIPYLSCKRKQAELALELIRYREELGSRHQGKRGRFANMRLEDEQTIVRLVAQIKAEKWEVASPLSFSRQPNQILDVSSTTLRSPGARKSTR